MTGEAVSHPLTVPKKVVFDEILSLDVTKVRDFKFSMSLLM